MTTTNTAAMNRNARGIKRTATVPRVARALIVSKADLLEAAWEMASLSNDVGCDDEPATLRRLVDVLNQARERRGQARVKMYARSAPDQRVVERVDAANHAASEMGASEAKP